MESVCAHLDFFFQGRTKAGRCVPHAVCTVADQLRSAYIPRPRCARTWVSTRQARGAHTVPESGEGKRAIDVLDCGLLASHPDR